MRNFTTRFLLVGLLVTFCLSINSYAQQRQVLETQSYTGKLVRTTPKLADIDRTTMYGKPLVKTRDKDGIIGMGEEMEETEERIERGFQNRNAGKGKVTEALQNINTHNPQVPGTSLVTSFDGQTSPGLSPTDNNMAAGPNHVIQAVNNTAGTQFTIWNKAGTVVQGPTILATITGFPGFGDPVVLYDQLADRWVIMEFGPNTTPIHTLNIAVSTTGNPTGTWKIYQYQDLTFFIDYEKISVWHNAYYMTSNDFNNAGTSYLGSSVYSLDRAAMIAGAPTTTMIRTRLTDAGQNFYNMGTIGLEGMTPSTLNGLFAYPIGPTTLNIFEVIPNFGAGTQTIGPNTALPIAAYATPPGTVPQQGGGTAGTLGERMMFKLNYRKNGTTESVVMTHTVGNAGLAAVRWYELRRVAGNWTVYQQGTVTGADGNSRFMGGISMDGCGNIALMYDVSGATANPSIRYTGRNSFDPLGVMTLPESVIINAAVGHPGNSRWGDYNTTVQDYSAPNTPLDGTFWSTSQYGNQSTRVSKFTLTNGCAPTVSLAAAGATIVAENCTPANGVIDPTEIVTVSLCLQNTGTLNTTNLIGTLQATGGVTAPSGPQNYGVVVGGGPAVCRNFSFTAAGSCGGTITATLQLQDGATNLGTITYTFTMGVLSTVFTQNFDAVVAPALPAGWVATAPTNLTGAPLWVTSSAGTPAPPAFSAPNAIFATDPGNITDNLITSPGIAITTATAKLSFRNNFSLESGFDGGVLEIAIPSVAAGAFRDILVAGGSFAANGYNGTISGSFGSPIANRQAWTGSNGGFQLVTVNLPAAAAGQTIQLRWREASDNSVSGVGWRVDDIVLTDGYTCATSCTPPPPPPCIITCPANITVNNTLNQCGAIVSYPAPTGVGVCGTITASPASGSFFPVGTTIVAVRSDVLYDQTGAFINAISSQNFEASITGFDTQAADDFLVPGGQVWTVSKVAVGGLFFNGSGIPTTTATVVFYNDAAGLPGSVVQSFSAVPVTGGPDFTATLPSNVVLNPGTYWVSVQVDLDFNPNGQWGWSTYGLTNTGSEAVWRNPGGAFATPCTNYAPVATGGCIPASGHNLIFRLLGSNSTPNCTFTITVLDVQAPTITCPANITTNTAAGVCTASVVTPNAVTADNCSVSKLTWVMTGATTGSSPLTGINNVGTATFNGGVTTVTYTASDPSNNTATCSFTVTVNDNQPPTITCPANIARNADPGLCSASVVTPNPTTADNCSVTKLTWSMTGATVATSPATGINFVGTKVFNVGVTTVTYTASDANGNNSTCSFTVTVTDTQAPTITCPANFSGITPVGSCTLSYATPNPVTADNCGVTVLTWVMTGATTGTSPATGINFVGTKAFNIGVTTITYTAKDASNNATSCSFTVTVADAQLPVITAQPTTRTVCEGTSTTFSVTATNTLTYQWQLWNGTAWVNTGTNSSTLTINPTTLAMNTNTFRVLLNGLCSVVTSANASLYVNRLPTISIAASRIPILLPGESVNLVATVDPAGGTFVWLKNGVAVPGVTGGTLSGLTVDDIGSYRARYTDLNGCVQTSNEIIVSGAPSGNLYVFPNPNFGQFSVRFFNQVGETATVNVFDAKGAKVYQRQLVTTTAYTRLDIDLGPTLSSGVYIVEVVNSAGKRMGAKRVVVRHQ
ncbi:MAG: HYR domain-containing protein [Chitinophagaceae bacterium]